ncbi:hypothetical protein K438DRAFT_1985257 [Mycena galopus ATCC 62051]|nr:hypothetical protein K438DRAFT_1985257 [Mycena galopus ATCC 62051]
MNLRAAAGCRYREPTRHCCPPTCRSRSTYALTYVPLPRTYAPLPPHLRAATVNLHAAPALLRAAARLRSGVVPSLYLPVYARCMPSLCILRPASTVLTSRRSAVYCPPPTYTFMTHSGFP